MLDSSVLLPTDALRHVVLVTTVCVGDVIIDASMLVSGSQYTDEKAVTLSLFITD